MSKSQEPHQSSGGIVVLQWLSYAFWGWLALGLTWLLALVLIHFIIGPDDINGAIPYALAAVIVLLPIAFVTDLFYRKREPARKQGASMVIMIVHAVLFALIAIGTLVGAVFVGLQLLIDSSVGSLNSLTVALYTLLFTTVMYGVLFLRVLNPFKTPRLSLFFGIGALAISLACIILAIVGPVAQSITLRTDRLIQRELYTVSSGITDYVAVHDTLPASLNDITPTSKDGQRLIDEELVVYKPEGVIVDDTDSKTGQSYGYQLCVTYIAATQNYRPSSLNSQDVYPDTYQHPAGEVCYKLRTYALER